MTLTRLEAQADQRLPVRLGHAWSGHGRVVISGPPAQQSATTHDASRHRQADNFDDCIDGMGLDACDAGSQASSAASALIVELHLRLGPKLKSKAAKIGAGFVDTCLHHLRTSVSRIRALALDAATAPAPPAVVNATDAGGSGGGSSNGSTDGVKGDGGPSDDDSGGGRVFEKMGQLLGGGGGDGRNSSRTSQRHNR